MKKYLIYLGIMGLTTIGIRELPDYPVLQTISALGWCAAGALLIHKALTDIMGK